MNSQTPNTTTPNPRSMRLFGLPQGQLFSLADAFVLLLLASVIYGITSLAAQWNGQFQPVVPIELSLLALPKYALFSAGRGLVAYFISLTFALVYGYIAANSHRMERFMILFLDILQSIPVLGFLPGLVFGLIALFPHSNFGLELAAVLMIFTSQAWNMCFSFHSSLRSVPPDLNDAVQLIGLGRWRRLTRLELPLSSVGLAWNSLLSMAGGWFFLTICETFTLGDHNFRLPGLGSYMALAIDQGNNSAMFLGIVAMMTVILVMDVIIWRPILVWVQRYRFEGSEGIELNQSFMLQLFQESRLLRRIQLVGKKLQQRYSKKRLIPNINSQQSESKFNPLLNRLPFNKARAKILPHSIKVISLLLQISLVTATVYGVVKLGALLHGLSGKFWILLLRDSFWTLLRIIGSMILATLWAVPVGVLIGLSPRATRIAQPIVQVVAAFPAPMIYPLILSFLMKLNVSIEVGSMALMMIGSQWYVLFNVLAGALGISHDLQATLSLTTPRKWTHWKRLYLPGIFPSLVVGWITAAGGFWNSAIVTEFIRYEGKTVQAHGLGATISRAAEEANFPALAAGLLMIVCVVVLMNRLVWQRLSEMAERRFQFER